MPISRRSFLKAGLAAVAAALGVFALKSAQEDGASVAAGQAAPPQAPGRQQFTYRGRRVIINETGRSIDVMIDGQHQHHIQKKTPQRGQPFYLTHLLPFENFSSPREMVRAIIDGEADMELFDLR